MVTVPLDVRPHAAAITALVEARITPWKLYAYGNVPGDKNNPVEAERKLPLPNLYGLLTVERRYMPANRRNAQASRSAWRTTLRLVGRTVDESLWLDNRVSLALNEKRLTVAGRTTTLVQHESSTSPEPDDGRFSALVIYIYAH